jgi:pyridoxal phosphate enzyme (YggS family)
MSIGARDGTSVATGLARVRQSIEDAAASVGRDPAEVHLIAVSKGFSSATVRQALDAGQIDFGENRAQEAEQKHREVGQGVRWHFIGRLQRNKVTRLVGFTYAIHSVDRKSLASEINSRAEVPMKVLAQVNLSGEQQKAGVTPNELPDLVEAILGMPRLDLIGLMTMAPRLADAESARPLFAELARLRADVSERFSSPRIHHLSMGMSQDYVVAVEEGATMVRIGEAIFGPRGRPELQSSSVDAYGSRKVSP